MINCLSSLIFIAVFALLPTFQDLDKPCSLVAHHSTPYNAWIKLAFHTYFATMVYARFYLSPSMCQTGYHNLKQKKRKRVNIFFITKRSSFSAYSCGLYLTTKTTTMSWFFGIHLWPSSSAIANKFVDKTNNEVLNVNSQHSIMLSNA